MYMNGGVIGADTGLPGIGWANWGNHPGQLCCLIGTGGAAMTSWGVVGFCFASPLALVGGSVVGFVVGLVAVGFAVGALTSIGQQSLPQIIWHKTTCGFWYGFPAAETFGLKVDKAAFAFPFVWVSFGLFKFTLDELVDVAVAVLPLWGTGVDLVGNKILLEFGALVEFDPMELLLSSVGFAWDGDVVVCCWLAVERWITLLTELDAVGWPLGGFVRVWNVASCGPLFPLLFFGPLTETDGSGFCSLFPETGWFGFCVFSLSFTCGTLVWFVGCSCCCWFGVVDWNCPCGDITGERVWMGRVWTGRTGIGNSCVWMTCTGPEIVYRVGELNQ